MLLGIVAAALAATGAAAQTVTARAAAPRDPRTLLGVSVGLSASDRDTLGVLVAAVAPGSPAEQAGISQGSRIAAVEGVSVRVDPEDVGRQESGDAVLRRLARTLQGVEPGSEVSLRIYADGRYQLVKVQTAAPRPPEPAAEELAWAATGEAAPTRRGAAPTSVAAPVSVAGVMDALANLQTQVHRLSQDQETGPLLDTLEVLDQELGALRRRLRAAQSPALTPTSAPPRRAAPALAAAAPVAPVATEPTVSTAASLATKPAPAASPAASTPASAAPAGGGGPALPGLNVTTVSPELVSYFGEGSERGLLVLQADSSWAPIKTGDILLSVNGAPVTTQRLKATLASHRQSAVELLRRKRPLTVALPPRG